MSATIAAINARVEELNRAKDTLSQAWNLFDRTLNALNELRAEVTALEARTPAPLHEQIVNMLSGEYKLRSTQALVEATGKSREEILNALTEAGVPVVLKRRRNDNAELVGLLDRQ